MSSGDAPAQASYEVGTAAFKRRFMIRLWAVLVGGTILDGYILGVIGPQAPILQSELGLSTVEIGLIASMALVGIFVGAPIAGWATDKFGRKPIFIADISLFLVAAMAQFWVESAVMLMVIRFAMGFAIGAEYAVSWPMMAEFSPTKIRGRLLAISNGVFYVGFMLGYAFSYYAGHFGIPWRIVLGSSAAIALALLLGRIGLPESARWLWAKGRHEEARVVAHKFMGGEADVADFQKEVARTGDRGKFTDIFAPEYVRSTIFISVFWFATVLPYFGIATFAEEVLAQYGLSGGIAGGVGLQLVSVAGVVVLILFIDKVGRRTFAVPPLWVMAIVMLVIGLWSGAPAPLVLSLFLVFSFLSGMVGPLSAIYPGELFPTKVRGQATGFSAAVSRIGAAIGTYFVPVGIDTIGVSAVMLILAGVLAVGAVVSQAWAPETRGKDLSETVAGSIQG